MRRITTLIFALFLCFQCWTQPLDIRPQFGHDPIWGDITEDGQYAITAGRNSVVLWNLKKEQIIIEQPINCMSAQFVTGFPFNYVALNLIHNNGSLDSSEEKRTIVDILTGKEIFKMSSNSIKKGHNSSFQISFPFDSLGRFDVIDNVGNTHRLFGGKINGGMGNVEISSDNELLLVGGKHPVLWDLNEMRIHSSIPLYEHFMKNKEIVDPGLNIQPVLRTTIKETRKGTIKTGWRQFFKAHFVKDGDIISGTPDGRICVFSKEGQFLREYKTKPLSQNILDCALFDNTILGATANNWAAIGQLNRDSLLVCSANEKEGVQLYRIVYEVLPIPDRDIFICTSDGGIYIGNLRHPENGMEVVPTPREVLSAEIIDKDSVLLTGVTGYYYILNLNTLAVDTYKSGIDNDFHAAIVLSDGTILLGGHYGKVVVIDGKEMTPINIMSFGNGTIHGFAEDINRSRIYLSSSDGALRVIDSRSFDLIVTCYNLGDNESIIVAPDGYFSADKGVADLMMYGRGAELFSFDHFDLLRNRPDIIKERLGGRPEEVALLKRVYEKRLRRMGFSNSMLHESTHLPDVAITRFPNVEKVSVDKISMRVQFKDRVYPIKKVLAWINGTPIFGRDGLSVEGKVIEKDIDLALATGENIIEVSCINSAGVESLRESRTITFTNPNARKNLYIVAMGVSRYRQPGQELNYAAKDAGDIVSLFAECGQGLYVSIR